MPFLLEAAFSSEPEWTPPETLDELTPFLPAP